MHFSSGEHLTKRPTKSSAPVSEGLVTSRFCRTTTSPAHCSIYIATPSSEGLLQIKQLKQPFLYHFTSEHSTLTYQSPQSTHLLIFSGALLSPRLFSSTIGLYSLQELFLNFRTPCLPIHISHRTQHHYDIWHTLIISSPGSFIRSTNIWALLLEVCLQNFFSTEFLDSRFSAFMSYSIRAVHTISLITVHCKVPSNVT